LWRVTVSQKCDMLLVFGSSEHAEPFRYLTNFVPILGDMWTLMTGPEAMTCGLNFHWELKEAAKVSGISDWHGIFTPGPFIAEKMNRIKPQRVAVLGMNRIPWVLFNEIRKATPGVEMVDINTVFEDMRKIKSPLEIRLLAKSAAIVDEAISAAKRTLEPGITEKEISAEILYTFNRHGAEAAFRPGVLGGVDEDSAVIARSLRSRPLESGDTVMMDIGATYNGYQSDVARTFVLGKPSALQEKIWGVIRSVFDAVIEKAKPGVVCNELHKTAEKMINAAGYQLIHRVGHGVGLATSFEWPSVDTENAVLLPGMTLAIEPAIYEVGAGAMKIEDMLVITETGCELLSKSPYELET